MAEDESIPKHCPAIILKDVPEDVRKVIIRQQAKEKEFRGTNQFSMASVIYKIIREWNQKK
jgi:hypothetical protein